MEQKGKELENMGEKYKYIRGLVQQVPIWIKGILEKEQKKKKKSSKKN